MNELNRNAVKPEDLVCKAVDDIMAVHEPSHYRKHPSGVECKDITKHMNFCLGNAIKYIWRCDYKGKAIEDLKKAKEYLDIEIERRQANDL